MFPSSLRAVVCGNVNVEVGFSAPALPLPAVESADFPGALTLGVSGVGFNVVQALARPGADGRSAGHLSWAELSALT